VGVILLWVGVFPRESQNPILVAQLARLAAPGQADPHMHMAGQQAATRPAGSRGWVGAAALPTPWPPWQHCYCCGAISRGHQLARAVPRRRRRMTPCW
jgi:hypothetical protein